jgi:hypothetical protein
LAVVGIFTALLVATVLILNVPNKSKPAYELSRRSDQAESLSTPAPAERLAGEEKAKWNFSADKATSPQTVAQVEPTQPAKELSNKIDTFDDATTSADVRAEASLAGEAFKSKLPSQSESNLGVLDDGKVLSVTNGVTATGGSFATAVSSSELPAQLRKSSPASAAAPTSLFFAETDLQPRQRFVQQDLRAKYRQNLLSPSQPKILQSFELVQNGNEIRLIDSDGSVYEGKITSSNENELAKKAVQTKAEKSLGIAFRVSGTNQRLNQIVTFTGNFARADLNQNSLKDAAGQTADTFSAGEFKRQAGISGIMSNASIHGKVSIGGTNEFEIQSLESR